MIQDHPWFGVGPERVGPTFMDYLPPDVPKELPVAYYAHLHNTFVHYAAERGLPIVLALLWLFGKVLWDMSRALRRAPPGQVMSASCCTPRSRRPLPCSSSACPTYRWATAKCWAPGSVLWQWVIVRRLAIIASPDRVCFEARHADS